MKTEVRVNELNHTLNNLIWGQLQVDPRSSMLAETAFKLIDWTKATDEERLAYAEWRYPKGTQFKCVLLHGQGKVESYVLNDEKIFCAGGSNEKGFAMYVYANGKWAEIISEPEEKECDKPCGMNYCDENGCTNRKRLHTSEPIENPLFKVGDCPQWTPELIKQLPHGTVLECAYQPEDVFTYKGQEIDYDAAGDMIVLFSEIYNYFEYKKGERYAKILSLPDIREASPSAQQEFVKANPGMQHVEEPKAGDMVEARINGWPDGNWRDRKYLCKNSFGKFVCEYKDGSVEIFDEIRLPQKSEVESKAKEILETWIDFGDDAGTIEVVTNAIKSAIKWGQANPGKI